MHNIDSHSYVYNQAFVTYKLFAGPTHKKITIMWCETSDVYACMGITSKILLSHNYTTCAFKTQKTHRTRSILKRPDDTPKIPEAD